jgi:hypothetical protein
MQSLFGIVDAPMAYTCVLYDAVLAHVQHSAVALTPISSFINVIHEAHYADDQELCLRRGRAGL